MHKTPMYSKLFNPEIVVGLLLVLAVSQCPPPGFDSVPNFNLTRYISAPWFIQQQVMLYPHDVPPLVQSAVLHAVCMW
jgi:hypothetical protein